MKVEIFTHTERLLYLQKEMNKKLIVLNEPEEDGQVKISIEVVDGLDILKIFHA